MFIQYRAAKVGCFRDKPDKFLIKVDIRQKISRMLNFELTSQLIEILIVNDENVGKDGKDHTR